MKEVEFHHDFHPLASTLATASMKFVFLKVCTLTASLSPVRLYSSMNKKVNRGKDMCLTSTYPRIVHQSIVSSVHFQLCQLPLPLWQRFLLGKHEPSTIWVEYPNLRQDFQLFRAFFSRVDSRCVNNEKQSRKEPMPVGDCPVT